MNQPRPTALEIDLVSRLRQMSLAFQSSYARLSHKSGIWFRVEGLHDEDQYSSGVDALESRDVMKPLYERLLKSGNVRPIRST